MAEISIPPSPHTLSSMSNRRVPLANNTNAINSPYRAVAAAATKQKRSYANVQREDAYGQPPPAKKQMTEASQAQLRTPPRQPPVQSAEGRVFTRKNNGAQPTAFERRCAQVARETKAQQAAQKIEKVSTENLENIRQWQKHYRRVFPEFVFFFENVAEDIRQRCAKQVVALGAVSSHKQLCQHCSEADTVFSVRRNSSRMP